MDWNRIGQRPTDTKLKKWGRKHEFDIPGFDPPDGVYANPPGKYYAGKSHTGCHCAEGLQPAERQAADYSDPGKGIKPYEGTCIMFGAGELDDNTKKDFCADCQKHLKNEDLSDVKKNWIAMP